jgi:hypothetical protein
MKEISIDEAMRRLPPVKPTTLDRMRDAAFAEVSRVESGQMSRMVSGLIEKPMPEQMVKRDDLFGVVQLIDLILSDQVLLDRFKECRRAQKASAPAPVATGDEEIEVAA